MNSQETYLQATKNVLRAEANYNLVSALLEWAHAKRLVTSWSNEAERAQLQLIRDYLDIRKDKSFAIYRELRGQQDAAFKAMLAQKTIQTAA